MKILLTGGGTGGHFYPLIAVAREIEKILKEKHFLEAEIIFASDSPYDKKNLIQENIKFLRLPAGKIRRYFSLWNFIDPFKTALGVALAIWKIYLEMPDVIFSKGGYASFPVLIAARIFGIPLIIHESDSAPGKANSYAGAFAKKIAISFPETAKFFPPEKTVLTGVPIRKEVLGGSFFESRDIFSLEISEEKIFPPVILIFGGSQGAQKINEILLEILPELVSYYQIIHQCGGNNFAEVKKISGVVLENSKYKNRYHLFPFLNEAELRNGSFAANLIISRAGATAIFEIAAWGKPSILIPLANSAQDHQKKNGWNYAETGAAEVIEEINFSPRVFLSEIKKIMEDEKKREKMKIAALRFSKPDAAKTIANEIIKLALEHG